MIVKQLDADESLENIKIGECCLLDGALYMRADMPSGPYGAAVVELTTGKSFIFNGHTGVRAVTITASWSMYDC